MSYNFKCKLLARSLQHEPPYHRRRQECVPRFHIGTMYMIIHNSFIAFFFRIKHLMGPGHRQVREMWPKQTLVWLMGWLQYMRLFQKKLARQWQLADYLLLGMLQENFLDASALVICGLSNAESVEAIVCREGLALTSDLVVQHFKRFGQC